MAASLSDAPLPPGFEIESMPPPTIPDGWVVEVKPAKPAEMRSYQPSWRERITSFLMGDERPSPERERLVTGLVGGGGRIGIIDLLPLGIPLAANEAERDMERGKYGSALVNAMAVIPAAKPAAVAARAGASAMREAMEEGGRKATDSTLRAKGITYERLQERLAENNSPMRGQYYDAEARPNITPPDILSGISPPRPAPPTQPGKQRVRDAASDTYSFRDMQPISEAPAPVEGAYVGGGPSLWEAMLDAVNGRAGGMADATREKLGVPRGDTRMPRAFDEEQVLLHQLESGDAAVRDMPTKELVALLKAQEAEKPSAIRAYQAGEIPSTWSGPSMSQGTVAPRGMVWMLNPKTGEVRNSLEIPGLQVAEHGGVTRRSVDGWLPLYEANKGRAYLTPEQAKASRALWGNPSGSLWDAAWMPTHAPKGVQEAVREMQKTGKSWGDVLADLVAQMQSSGMATPEIAQQFPQIVTQVARNLAANHMQLSLPGF